MSAVVDLGMKIVLDRPCNLGGANYTYAYRTRMVAGVVSYVHRLAWVAHHGRPVPPGLVVRHLCNHKSCKEPSHLALGTHAQNYADKQNTIHIM